MGYFRELPNIEYLSPLSNRNSASEYVEAKNLFKRVKLRDDFYSYLSNFVKYTIVDGKRPEHVAREVYGSSSLDWVVLISANITNVRDEWPLSDKDIYDFAENIYGNAMNDSRFYETIEVKDSGGRLILPAGQIVDYNFKSPKPAINDIPNSSYVSYWDSKLNQTITKYNITVPVTNYEYEVRLNNQKRQIYILKREYLQQFLNDMRGIMKYSKSSQYVNDKLKRGDNTRVKLP